MFLKKKKRGTYAVNTNSAETKLGHMRSGRSKDPSTPTGARPNSAIARSGKFAFGDVEGLSDYEND